MERRKNNTAEAASVLRSPLSTSASPIHHPHRRQDDNDEYNNNSNVHDVSAIASFNNTTSTTLLVDELEQLRTDNFQLRLRVYNAERRLDRLTAAATHERRGRVNDESDSDTDTSSSTDTDSSTDDKAARTAAAAKATAEAAVRTIHDLLTVNRRLLALLAATVTAKAVAVTADDKRRWKLLRNHIDDFAGVTQDDDESDTSAKDSETYTTGVKASARREAEQTGRMLSPPPPPPPPPPPLEDTPPVVDDGPGSELARLRGRCRRLERSLQQLVNTELWARNRQISKLEQQRYVTQVAEDARKERPPASTTTVAQQTHSTGTSPPAPTKGILVIRSPETTASKVAGTGATAVITTPPPVLPDYSEVNFFFSCDEDDDQEDTETNTSSSTEETSETEFDEVEKQSLQLEQSEAAGARSRKLGATVDAPPSATSTPLVFRKRQCRHRQRKQRQGAADVVSTYSSSTDSVLLTGEISGSGGGGMTTTSPMVSRRRRRTVSGGFRRRYRPRRYSRCGPNTGTGARSTPSAAVITVADAQVQCGDGGGVESVLVDVKNDDDQLLQLRRELNSRRRENSRLYEMLLRLQRGRQRDKSVDDGEVISSDGKSVAPLRPNDQTLSPDLENVQAVFDSDPDLGGSPEPYRRAARAVRSRIADLLPPLLSFRSTAEDPANPADASTMTEQQQQQLRLLARLRERIVAYERQELLEGDGGGGDGIVPVINSENAIRQMDRATLVNVALPQAVNRLRRALVPLMQHSEEREREQVHELEQPGSRAAVVERFTMVADDDRTER